MRVLTLFLTLLMLVGCSQLRPSIKHRMKLYGKYEPRTEQPTWITAEVLPSKYSKHQYTRIGWITIKVLRDDPVPSQLALTLGHEAGCDLIVMQSTPYDQYTEFDHNSHIQPGDRYSYSFAQFHWDKDEYRAECLRKLSPRDSELFRKYVKRIRKENAQREKKEAKRAELANKAQANKKMQRARQEGSAQTKSKASRTETLKVVLEVNKKACEKGASSFDFLACRIVGQMILPELNSAKYEELPKDRALGEKYLIRSCMSHPQEDAYGYAYENCRELIKYLTLRGDSRLTKAQAKLAHFEK